ncbi:lysozyme [Pseudanabaena phage Pan3]|nr:lysozyme [Pseudanabaena phage Pan3]
MPDNPQPPAKGRTVALVGAAAAASIFAVVAQWEGKENVPYRDIVGVWTVCYGDTQNVTPGKRETDAQCAERLDRQVAAHARPVLDCTPALRDPARRNQLVAAVSLAYNVGPRAYCRSSVDRHFDAGRWKQGCDALLLWNRAGGREVRGLTNRRRAEREICLTGL